MWRLSSLFLLIILAGCVSKKPENLLIGGQWKTKYNPQYGWWNRETFAFLNDSIVDTKHLPYFETDSTKGQRYLPKITRYLGTKTRYKIIGDSLKVYDLNEHKWKRGEKVVKLTRDTLVLKRFDDSVKVFVRVNYDITTKKHFDKIVLSSFPGWPTRYSVDVIVDRGGLAFLRVEDACYEANIGKDRFNEIEENFLRLDQYKVKPVYSQNGTDADHYSTTVWSEGKIRMSIYDYGPCGPDELIWAYSDLEYLHHNLNLAKVQKLEMPSYVQMRLKWFKFDGEEMNLTDSEAFLLSWYFRNGRKVNDDFPVKYKGDEIALNAVDDVLKDPKNVDKYLVKIESNGRLFRFYEPGKEPYTIDIGMDYLGRTYFVCKKRTLTWRNAKGNPLF